MSWQKINEMPCVLDAMRRVEKEIELMTGIAVILQISAIEISGDDRKKILQDIITSYFKITWHQVECKEKYRASVNARHIYMYLARTALKYTFVEIAKDCGNRHHTSVIHAMKKINGYYQVGDSMIKDIDAIKRLLPIKLTK